MTAKKPDEHDEAAKPVVPAVEEAHHDPIDPKTGLRGRPESPSDRPGQLTRDNVNPHIPSGKPGDPPGPIVDPKSLGMEQGGIAPTNPMQPEKSADQKPRLAEPPPKTKDK
jgi:hypothetical protein